VLLRHREEIERVHSGQQPALNIFPLIVEQQEASPLRPPGRSQPKNIGCAAVLALNIVIVACKKLARSVTRRPRIRSADCADTSYLPNKVQNRFTR